MVATKSERMCVIKRSGESETVSFDKITARNEKLCQDLDVDPTLISKKVIESIHNGIKTEELDILSAETALYMSSFEPDFEILAKRIIISNCHKTTNLLFSQTTLELLNMGLLDKDYAHFVMENKETLDSMIDYERDYNSTYFGFKTLEKSYLNKNKEGRIIERPQQLWLRVATFIRMPCLDKIKEVYDFMSTKYFTHASPTLFNAGMKFSQNSSCFLLSMNDQLEDMLDCLKKAGLISKFSGGIGINVSMIRSKGSHIHSTGGKSDGIVPLLKVWNSMARYVNQCFAPETIVFTKRGPECIENITTTDEVITLDGTFKPVNTVVKNELVDKPILTIEVQNAGESVRVTPEHEIYVLRRNALIPQFISAKDINVGDYVCFTSVKPGYEKETENSDNYFIFLGAYLASILQNSVDTSIIECKNERIHNTVKTVLKEYNATQLSINENPKIFFSITQEPLRTDIENLCNTLQFPQDFFYTMSKKNMYALLEGFIGNHGNTIPLSRNLNAQLQLLCLQAGFLYSNGIFTEPEFVRYDKMWTPVISIKEENYTGFVYDLNIEDNHNYLTTMGLVHNSGRRKGAVAVYLEPHHPDVFEFLKIRRNTTKEEIQCLDLHIAMWIPDLFMRRLREDGMWSLMDPNIVKGLHEVYGSEYESIYLDAEANKKYIKQVRAQELWKEILISQMETGEPYMMFKDNINRKSNQQNIGVIRGSNLCSEIVEYTDNDTVAVCNLCSISLPAFVNYETKDLDYKKLGYLAELITENMNILIDKNYYPIAEAKQSNMDTRPIGIGIQGLADVFQMLNLSWDDEKAKEINRNAYAVIYYHALKSSMQLAKQDGPYKFFKGSPAEKGFLQYDLCDIQNPVTAGGLLDWDLLKKDICTFGLRNSLVTTQMPTASTSQILGNNESFEPYTSNLYSRRVLAGEFIVLNQHLYKTLKELGLWSREIVNEIIAKDGSIQTIESIPPRVKDVFRTAWEIKTRLMVDYSIDRGAYIDQSQSFNVFMSKPTSQALSSMFMYEWEKGLKTGMYYLRRQTDVQAIKFSLMDDKKKVVCTDEVCHSCSA